MPVDLILKLTHFADGTMDVKAEIAGKKDESCQHELKFAVDLSRAAMVFARNHYGPESVAEDCSAAEPEMYVTGASADEIRPEGSTTH